MTVKTSIMLGMIFQSRFPRLELNPVFGKRGVFTLTVSTASSTAFKPPAKAVTVTVFVVDCFSLATQV